MMSPRIGRSTMSSDNGRRNRLSTLLHSQKQLELIKKEFSEQSFFTLQHSDGDQQQQKSIANQLGDSSRQNNSLSQTHNILWVFGCFNDLPAPVFTISRQYHSTTGALHHKTLVPKSGPNLDWAWRVESGFGGAPRCRPPATETEADSPARGKIERPVAFGHVRATP